MDLLGLSLKAGESFGLFPSLLLSPVGVRILVSSVVLKRPDDDSASATSDFMPLPSQTSEVTGADEVFDVDPSDFGIIIIF